MNVLLSCIMHHVQNQLCSNSLCPNRCHLLRVQFSKRYKKKEQKSFKHSMILRCARSITQNSGPEIVCPDEFHISGVRTYCTKLTVFFIKQTSHPSPIEIKIIYKTCCIWRSQSLILCAVIYWLALFKELKYTRIMDCGKVMET